MTSSKVGTQIYDPNFYFFTEQQSQELQIHEQFLLSIEVLIEVCLDTEDPIKDLVYEDVVESLKSLDSMYHKYLKDYGDFKTGDARGIIDTEHLMNLITIGHKNLPELDDITMRFATSISLNNLIHRIKNCYVGLIYALQKVYPERNIKNDIFSS